MDFTDPDDPTITSQTKYQDWTLDGLGNFSQFDDDGDSQDRTVDAANQIRSITGGSITPAYDNAGNMISGPSPDSPTTRVHYKYDAWNRLVKVQADNGGSAGTTIAEYSYDGIKRRVTKTLPSGETTDFYYNNKWQMVETVTDDGETTSFDQYVYSPRYIDSPIVRFHDGDADGYCTPGAESPDSIRYYLSDANHNITTTITTGSSGKTTEHIVYDAYGKATVLDDSWANGAAPTESGPLYCGYFFDSETDLYQVRNRYYDASISTFISRDPIGYRGGNNLYGYCTENPITRLDPRGTDGSSVGPANHLSEIICPCSYGPFSWETTNVSMMIDPLKQNPDSVCKSACANTFNGNGSYTTGTFKWGTLTQEIVPPPPPPTKAECESQKKDCRASAIASERACENRASIACWAGISVIASLFCTPPERFINQYISCEQKMIRGCQIGQTLLENQCDSAYKSCMEKAVG